MKNSIICLLAIVGMASCSAPKYSYYFDHQKNGGKKQSVAAKETSVLSVDPQMMMASTAPMLVAAPETMATPTVNADIKKTYIQMNKSERKTLRHQLKKDIKTYVAAKKKSYGVAATKAGMDHDLKLAIIFGAIGVVSFLIGTSVFNVIGSIAFIIGVVFFVKWIIRQ